MKMNTKELKAFVAARYAKLNWLAMSAEERKLLIMEVVFGRKSHPSPSSLPDWPTSIADAFEVVEKMREKGFICIVKNRTESNLWDCTMQQYSKIFSAVGTLPEAICLASLRAHGVEVEQREAKDL